jgi:hypothetical protein
MEFDADHRVEVGERLTLPDGTDVVVIGQDIRQLRVRACR